VYYILSALLRPPEQCWGLFWILCSTAAAAGAATEQYSVTPHIYRIQYNFTKPEVKLNSSQVSLGTEWSLGCNLRMVRLIEHGQTKRHTQTDTQTQLISLPRALSTAGVYSYRTGLLWRLSTQYSRVVAGQPCRHFILIFTVWLDRRSGVAS